MDRTIENLNKLAKELYKKYWGLELNIPVTINPRMYKWPARYTKKYVFENGVKAGIEGRGIEFSKHVIENYTDDGLIDALKHELCHHACLSQGKPYKDGSKYFESELERIDACSHNHSSDELLSRGHVARKRGKR